MSEAYPRRVIALVHGTTANGGCCEVEVGAMALRPPRAAKVQPITPRLYLWHETILVHIDGEAHPRRLAAERVRDVVIEVAPQPATPPAPRPSAAERRAARMADPAYAARVREADRLRAMMNRARKRAGRESA